MGCPKITYYQEGEGLEKSTVHFLGGLEEKKFASKFCDSYLPFGLTFNSYTSGTENLYKFTGKEEQQETEWYDFGARMYDPALARWQVVDPLAEKYYSSSPYNYVDGNPISRIDPNGMDWEQTEGGFTTTDKKDIARVLEGMKAMSASKEGNGGSEEKGSSENGNEGDESNGSEPGQELIETYESNKSTATALQMAGETLLELGPGGSSISKARNFLIEKYGDDKSKEMNEHYDNAIKLIRKANDSSPTGKLAKPYYSVIGGALLLKAGVLNELNSNYYAPKIKEANPNYYDKNIQTIFKKKFGGAGATGEW